MNLFKIWNQTREKKCLIAVPSENVFVSLILKASQKLNINGVYLVLESDGTAIDEDEVLLAVKDQTLIMLEKDEIWLPSTPIVSIPSIGSMSTNTLPSEENSFTGSVDSITECTDENQNTQPSTSNSVVNVEILNVVSSSEFLWTKSEIPWDKIPQDMIMMCEKGDRKKSVITEIVHIIINHLREISEHIPAKVLKNVANKMCEKYPLMFRDHDNDGVVMADGSCSIFCKLQERAAYLRRPHKRPFTSSPSLPPRLSKKKINIMSGCKNWASNINIDEEEEDEETTFKEKLNKMNEANEEFYNLLEKTYGGQRLFLNDIENPPTVEDILQQWPILFNKDCIVWHFQKLTNIDLDLLSIRMQEKSANIVEFGLKIKVLNSKDIKQMDKIEASLYFFAKYFKEDLTYFWTKSEEIVKTNAPCIVETQHGIHQNKFKIYMEKKKVIEAVTLLEAIKLAFGLYFVFNLEYPKEISTVLELIQRYYLKIHPDIGTRSKKHNLSKKKIIGLINKMKNV